MRLGDRAGNKKPAADQATGRGSPIALSQLAFLRPNDGLHPAIFGSGTDTPALCLGSIFTQRLC
jgi:hypothetical protein